MPIHILKFRIRVVVEPDDEGFHAYCPDLKGLHADGETEEEALKNAKCAARLYIESLLKHEEPLPIGVLESATRFGWAEACNSVRRAILPAPQERSYVEDIVLNATA